MAGSEWLASFSKWDLLLTYTGCFFIIRHFKIDVPSYWWTQWHETPQAL